MSDLLQVKAQMPMSLLQMRVTLMDMGSRGLQICLVLNSLSQVMDSVQIHHLALMLSNKRSICEVALVGGGSYCAHPSLCGALIWFWSTSIISNTCKQHWRLYFHLFLRDSTYSYVSEASTHHSIDVFCQNYLSLSSPFHLTSRLV